MKYAHSHGGKEERSDSAMVTILARRSPVLRSTLGRVPGGVGTVSGGFVRVGTGTRIAQGTRSRVLVAGYYE